MVTIVPNADGWCSLEDSAKLLRAIFPRYPELKPQNPAPAIAQATNWDATTETPKRRGDHA